MNEELKMYDNSSRIPTSIDNMPTLVVEGHTYYEFYHGYWISKCGKVASQWSKGKNSRVDRTKWYRRTDKAKPDNRKGYRGEYIPTDLYFYREDLEKLNERYVGLHAINGEKQGFQTTVNPERIRVTIIRHRLVMYVFKPYLDYCEETDSHTKEEYLSCPKSIQLVLAQQMLVDHIDGVRDNNNVDNLRWATSKQNASYKIDERKSSETISKHPIKDTPNVQYNDLTYEEKVDLGHLGPKASNRKKKKKPFLSGNTLDIFSA